MYVKIITADEGSSNLNQKMLEIKINKEFETRTSDEIVDVQYNTVLNRDGNIIYSALLIFQEGVY